MIKMRIFIVQCEFCEGVLDIIVAVFGDMGCFWIQGCLLVRGGRLPPKGLVRLG